MNRAAWNVMRLGAGAGILAVLAWRVGTGPFLDGVRTLSGWSLLAAFGITAVTTLCSAWRWTVVADGLRAGLPLSSATAAYYQSQFLNSALPGGVLGDVHRGVRHGRESDDIGRGLRGVAWDRAAGQVVQVVLAIVVLLALKSPVRSSMPVVIVVGISAAVVVALTVRGVRQRRTSRMSRIGRAIGADIRNGLLDRRAWPVVSLASVVVVVGHVGVFLIAARTVGVSASPQSVLPLGMLALLAMSVPLSIAGWGPREGVTAWAFGAAGLGADQGIATATAYGVMAFVATLPGALVLVVGWARKNRTMQAFPSPVPVAPPEPLTSGAVCG